MSDLYASLMCQSKFDVCDDQPVPIDVVVMNTSDGLKMKVSVSGDYKYDGNPVDAYLTFDESAVDLLSQLPLQMEHHRDRHSGQMKLNLGD